ncbi:hypothetical protein P3X46_004205 [Hevea brasiliensis]|uniref:GST N-terminal domain-containing protein n=1 Tax=Hevea brasiliensis TaxID=3981 RepID=A0ABQ9MXY2_HEVBR|nr:hypothetical protein P3X46_004205 [Hevea brasiliensis]
MAGVLNIPQSSFFRSIPSSRKAPRASISIIRATSETPLSSTSTSTTTNKEAEKLEASFTAPPNFKPLEPKPFTVKEGKILYILGASLALFFRLGTGVFVSGYSVSFVSENEIPPNQYALEVAGYKVKETSKVGPRREKPIEIYDLESCPFCRKVREIVAVLDIDVLFYPCPKNGPTFRPKVVQMGGKQQFRYMVDPNTGTAMYESDDIIKYLVGKYGDGNFPLMLSLGLLMTLTEGFAMIGRMGKGSPFCKIVRETLVELELPHIQNSCARGSSKRQLLYQKAGHFQVPYLEDPNTGVQMFESADIVEF